MNEIEQPNSLTAVFANADTTKTTTFPATTATGSSAVSFADGVPPICSLPLADGGLPLNRDDVNGMAYMFSQYLMYMQVGGQFTFEQRVSDAIGGYPLGAILFASTTVLPQGAAFVKSLKANNTDNFVTTPSFIGNGTSWEIVIGGATDTVSPNVSKNLLKSDLSNLTESGRNFIKNVGVVDTENPSNLSFPFESTALSSTTVNAPFSGRLVVSVSAGYSFILNGREIASVSPTLSGATFTNTIPVSIGDTLKYSRVNSTGGAVTISTVVYPYVS